MYFFLNMLQIDGILWCCRKKRNAPSFINPAGGTPLSEPFMFTPQTSVSGHPSSSLPSLKFMSPYDGKPSAPRVGGVGGQVPAPLTDVQYTSPFRDPTSVGAEERSRRNHALWLEKDR